MFGISINDISYLANIYITFALFKFCGSKLFIILFVMSFCMWIQSLYKILLFKIFGRIFLRTFSVECKIFFRSVIWWKNVVALNYKCEFMWKITKLFPHNLRVFFRFFMLGGVNFGCSEEFGCSFLTILCQRNAKWSTTIITRIWCLKIRFFIEIIPPFNNIQGNTFSGWRRSTFTSGFVIHLAFFHSFIHN